MPLRKTKSRRRPATSATSQQMKESNKEDKAVSDLNPDTVESRPESEQEAQLQTADGGDMDEEERKARETIALLAKKYQVTNNTP